MKKHSLLDRAAHIFNSSSQKAETGFCFFEFEANLTYLILEQLGLQRETLSQRTRK